MNAIRSILFYVAALVLTPIYCVIGTLILPLPARIRYRIVSTFGWTRLMMWVVEYICGIKYKVEGLENLQGVKPAIICSKHQSAWETMALQMVFPPQVYIAKKELLYIPFFGWGLATISTIFIDRSAGVESRNKMLDVSKKRLNDGFWIVIFPEGTRTEPGAKVKYKKGAADMARALEVPLVPVAHNAGDYWPKNSWMKRPGTITVSIGRPIYPDGRDLASITNAAHAWIEGEVARIRQ
ncbi:1-acyl-sn-glycerol-3-phosphate acyltransferase [Leeia sp. TBRC 13508]|uniref:1-acyl-sn-glycerol-3-phosphate acyltransferase n=1 Tax=Leeia speluncae TaxID=2884804 RepID=A0ABS8D5X7_9NEIS|nr:lysophospholipid acyltransferase family protein [Leeia speluncae]MCB6183371.1 1-acyl-sn-glycerol-3-phosphate acyltransferase [Leeia speluncae]